MRCFLFLFFKQSVIFDEIGLPDLSVAECSTKNANHSFQVNITYIILHTQRNCCCSYLLYISISFLKIPSKPLPLFSSVVVCSLSSIFSISFLPDERRKLFPSRRTTRRLQETLSLLVCCLRNIKVRAPAAA